MSHIIRWGQPIARWRAFPAGSAAADDQAIRARVEAVTLAALRALTRQSPPAPFDPEPDGTVSATFGAGAAVMTPRLTGFSEGQDFQFGTPLPEAQSSPAGSGLRSDRRLVGLGDEELLERLLEYVASSEASISAAVHAIRRFGSFAAVLNAPEFELQAIPGLRVQSIAAIKLVHAAALRLSRAAVIGRPVLDGSAALINYLTAMMARDSVEQFRILFLDARGRLRADEAQARGTVNHTPVYPREVVRRALELKAESIILVHNHPSGDPTPSAADITMTSMIKEAAEVVGLSVADHIIVGNGRWLSFKKEGLL